MNYLIEEIQEIKAKQQQQSDILSYSECYDYLRFLIVFSMGYTQLGIDSNIFEKAIPEFISLMNYMGYGSKPITKMVTQISTQPDTTSRRLIYNKEASDEKNNQDLKNRKRK